MPPDSAYSTGGGGKLKLKGSKTASGRVEKKKPKKKSKRSDTESRENTGEESSSGAVLRTADTEPGLDSERERERGEEREEEGEGIQNDGTVIVGKTETEKKYEEQRKKRLHDRLKREGVKTHKERVEELNKYLSTLSEHHDMPKIGPG